MAHPAGPCQDVCNTLSTSRPKLQGVQLPYSIQLYSVVFINYRYVFVIRDAFAREVLGVAELGPSWVKIFPMRLGLLSRPLIAIGAPSANTEGGRGEVNSRRSGEVGQAQYFFAMRNSSPNEVGYIIMTRAAGSNA